MEAASSELTVQEHGSMLLAELACREGAGAQEVLECVKCITDIARLQLQEKWVPASPRLASPRLACPALPAAFPAGAPWRQGCVGWRARPRQPGQHPTAACSRSTLGLPA
jgi:hypothetical protein